jgi:hypothetical protein
MTTVENEDFLSLAGDHIVSRLFEDELTLINLDSGDYFAAGGVVADIWHILATPTPLDRLIDKVSARYRVDPAVAAEEIRTHVAQLLAHGLIARVRPAAAEPRPPAPVPSEPADWPNSWFETYSDMKDLLLLDPVHDVEDGVWPLRTPEN